MTPEAKAESVNSQEIYREWRRALWPGEQCHRSDQPDGYGVGQKRGTNLVCHTVTVFTWSHFHPQHFMLEKCSPSVRLLKDAHPCSAVCETLGTRVLEGRECGGEDERGREDKRYGGRKM